MLLKIPLKYLIPLLVLIKFQVNANTEFVHGINVIDIYRNHLRRMDEIVDHQTAPCDDFFRHACGNYENVFNSFVEGKEDNARNTPPHLYNNEDRMHFFEQHRQQFTTATGKLLSSLYDSCKDRRRSDVIRGEAPSLWQRMLREIPFLQVDGQQFHKEWPFLRHQWLKLSKNYEFDWIAMAAEFASHGVSTFFHIFFADHTIYIGPTEHAACPSEDVIAADLLSLMDTKRPKQIANIVAYELSILCRLLNGQLLLPSDEDTADRAAKREIIIDDTIALYFQNFFAILNFTETEFKMARKIPVDIVRLSEILNVVQATEPRILYNYVLWSAYTKLKYEDCYELTAEWQVFLHAEYWNWHVFGRFFSRDVAMASYLLYNTRFYRQRQQTLMSREWRKVLRPSKAERRDYNVKRVLQNYGNSQLNAEELKRVYLVENDHRNESSFQFYAELLQLRLLRLRHSFRTPSATEFGDGADDDVNEPSYFMEHFLNFIQLIVQQPLYHYFATQSLDLWSQSNILYSTDGYYTAWDCLERQFSVHDNDGDGDDAVVNLYQSRLKADEVRELFGFYTAFVEAHRDYKFWLESEFFSFVEDVVLANYTMDSERVMFYAVAQLYCQRNDDHYAALINRSFRNVPAFQEAFHCPMGSIMNPTVKCMVKKCTMGGN